MPTKRRKELIEVRNQADNTIYTAEKMLREYGDKVPGDVKKKIEDGDQPAAPDDEQRKHRRDQAAKPKSWARDPEDRREHVRSSSRAVPQAGGPGPEDQTARKADRKDLDLRAAAGYNAVKTWSTANSATRKVI